MILQHFLIFLYFIILEREVDMRTDTIAAIATPMGNSGIGIIRVSGEDSIKIVDIVYRNRKNDRVLFNYKGNTIHYGFIYDGDDILDEVMVSVMRKPKSFTMEDTVEINCHGGILVMNRVLELLIKNGARLAQPGEFTKRAFLNGRIDLSEAEAVMDIISSENELALRNSVRQLRGSLYDKIKSLRESIIYEIAFIESALDDPEHISLEGYPERLNEKVVHLTGQIQKLLSSAENGMILKQGIRTVIVGKPNVGKSSLLNILAGEERAIVTDIAGTTRDILEENIMLDGVNLHVIDTAGIRSTKDVIERIGVEKAKRYANEADLIVYVVDSSVPLDQNDFEIIEIIKNKKAIVLINKSDLKSNISLEELIDKLGKSGIIVKTSTKENKGIDDFSRAVKKLFFDGEISFDNEVVITNLRHKEALQETLDSLGQVKRSLDLKMPEDFYSIDLMAAYSSLGRIIGEEVGEDLINEIFSKFCLGK